MTMALFTAPATADAIVVGDDIYVANGDIITRVDPQGNKKVSA